MVPHDDPEVRLGVTHRLRIDEKNDRAGDARCERREGASAVDELWTCPDAWTV
jgi:hypothetical protein